MIQNIFGSVTAEVEQTSENSLVFAEMFLTFSIGTRSPFIKRPFVAFVGADDDENRTKREGGKNQRNERKWRENCVWNHHHVHTEREREMKSNSEREQQHREKKFFLCFFRSYGTGARGGMRSQMRKSFVWLPPIHQAYNGYLATLELITHTSN